MKKLLAALLTASMAVGLMTGCGDTGASSGGAGQSSAAGGSSAGSQTGGGRYHWNL